MSEQQNNGQRRNQSGNRNNNRNNNNRNNNNRNRSNNNNNRTHKKSTPKPLVLSGWQKFLKMIGLFNEEKARKAHQQAEKVNNSLNQKSKPSHKRDDSGSSNSANTKKTANNSNNTSNAKPRRAPEKVAVETPRLYVGNLSYDASDSDIEELFKGIGNVKNVEIIYNRHTHRSKGYGFVQMFNTDDAKRAVDVLHDQPFLGRNLIVNGSKARNPDDPAAQKNNDNAQTADTSAA